MRKSKIIIISLILISLFFLIKLCFFNNKISKFGNNSIEEIEQNILNINSYEALITVTVQSNKNSNTYILKQKCVDSRFYQEVIEPSNIKGTIIELNGTDFKISNTKLSVAKIFQNYKSMTLNHLWLDYFIKDYLNSNKSSSEEKDTQIILKTVNEKNKYNIYKTLYIDKKSQKPTKMVIQDINRNDKVYILYNEIQISDINRR